MILASFFTLIIVERNHGKQTMRLIKGLSLLLCYHAEIIAWDEDQAWVATEEFKYERTMR